MFGTRGTMALDNWRLILGEGGSLHRKDQEDCAHPVPSAQPSPPTHPSKEVRSVYR